MEHAESKRGAGYGVAIYCWRCGEVSMEGVSMSSGSESSGKEIRTNASPFRTIKLFLLLKDRGFTFLASVRSHGGERAGAATNPTRNGKFGCTGVVAFMHQRFVALPTNGVETTARKIRSTHMDVAGDVRECR